MNKFIEIDILGDENDDVRIESSFFFDSGEIRGTAINDDIMLSYTTQEGDPFTAFWDHSLIAQTTIICYWSDLWLPGSGERYVGFYSLNQSQDTTFGWIKMDFRGELDSCDDTLLILESAYNVMPNTPLDAGEILTSSIHFSPQDFHLTSYPNPTSDIIHIELTGIERHDLKYYVFNHLGSIMSNKQIDKNHWSIDVSQWVPGVYYLSIQDSTSKTLKFIKFIKT